MSWTWGPPKRPEKPFYVMEDLDQYHDDLEAYRATRIGKLWQAWQDLKRVPGRVYWFLKYELVPRHRYHWLDLRDAKYRRGYSDYCWRLPQAAFKILSDFAAEEYGPEYSGGWTQKDVEEEIAKGDPYQSATGIQVQVDLRTKVLALLQWWNVERHQEWEVVHAMPFDRSDGGSIRAHFDASEALQEKLTEKLVELARLRRQLWA